MLEQIINKLQQFKIFINLLWFIISISKRFAIFLNPFLSIQRFWKIRRIDNRIADWCFTPENDIEGIIKDRPSRFMMASFEIHFPNYAYGHAKIFKSYAGLPDTYPIKVCYSHGASFNRLVFDPHLPQVSTFNFDIPVFLAWGRFEEKNMQFYRPQNKVYIVGSPFLYADSFFSERYIQQERNRLGRNLLVFPGHSSMSLKSLFDESKFINEILQRYKSQFDNIRICMYWKDIELKRHKYYIENGIECVTAGNSLDTNFLPRLKGLFQMCDAVITNSIGTHVGYSISLNKPISMLSTISYDISKVNYNMQKYMSEDNLADEYRMLENLLLSNDDLKITDQICEVIEPFWGLQEKKTKEELRQIFFEAEQLFQKSCKRYYFLNLR